MISFRISDREYDSRELAHGLGPPRRGDRARRPSASARPLLTRHGDLLGAAVIGVLAIACCGLLPAVVVLVSAAGLAALVGAGVALLVAAAAAVALLVGRRRARRSCAPGDGS
jgi:Flp pilus assembly protein TadB